MLSIKLKFRSSDTDEKEGSLYYQIIYKRVVREIATQYKIKAEEWNEELGTLKIAKKDDERKHFLQMMLRRIQWDIKRLMKITECCMNSGSAFSANSIIDAFRAETNDATLFKYAERLIVKLQMNGQMRTSETYCCALQSFRRFRQGKDLHFVELDVGLMVSYECYLKSRGLSLNTISFYMKKILKFTFEIRLISQSCFRFFSINSIISFIFSSGESLRYTICPSFFRFSIPSGQ